MRMMVLSFGLLLSASPLIAQSAETLPTHSVLRQCPQGNVGCPSILHQRIDRSFSQFPIDSLFLDVADSLTEIAAGSCLQLDQCHWQDRNGVRHFFWPAHRPDRRIVLKYIFASDFIGRPIEALGIGTARDRATVAARINVFLGADNPLDCRRFPRRGDAAVSNACLIFLRPGAVVVHFDEHDQLDSIRYDGYWWIE